MFSCVPMSSRFFLLCSLCNISANYLSHLVVSAFSTNRFTLYTAMLIFISVPLSPKTPVRHFFQFLFIKAIQSDNNIIYILGLELVLGCSHSSFLSLTSGSAKMSPSRGQNIFMAAKMDSVVFYYSVSFIQVRIETYFSQSQDSCTSSGSFEKSGSRIGVKAFQ